MEYPKFKVCVRCFTFNHSKYITDALNGFVMQQTDFPYVCCIVDDASTDGEQEVIRKYVADNFDLSEGSCHFERETDYAFITYAQHKSNKNCYFAVLYLKENHYSIKKSKMPYLAEWQDGCEYHALCEGDDYWIHPEKLQMQAEFLDRNEKYSFCHTGFDILYEERNQIENGDRITLNNEHILASGENLMEAIIDGNRYRVQTLTIMFRLKFQNVVDEILSEYRGVFLMGDTPLFVCLLALGSIGFLPISTSIYRRNANSASNQINFETKARFSVSCEEMRLALANKFGLSKQLIRKRQKRYQHNLNILYCYDKNYRPYVNPQFNTKFDRFLYNVLKSPIIIPVLRKYHQIRLTLASKNSI